MGIKTVPHPPYSPEVALCDFWLLPVIMRLFLFPVVMRQLRRWKRLWRRSLTHIHKGTSIGPSRSCWNGRTSALQLKEITSKGTRVSCVPAVRVFANGPGDLGSIPGRVIPKTLKMELDTTLLNTQHYKVRFKGKVEQAREWSSALPYTLV